MNSLENVFARRAEKTSEAICETVRDSWPARRCNLHDGLENFDNLMESVYSVTSNVDRIWESIDRMNFPEHLREYHILKKKREDGKCEFEFIQDKQHGIVKTVFEGRIE